MDDSEMSGSRVQGGRQRSQFEEASSSLDMNTATKRQQGKAVQFPEDPEKLVSVVEEITSREDWTDEDCALLWFSHDEYQALKSEARLEGIACERNGSSRNLDDVFVEKSRDSQEKLNAWVKEEDQNGGSTAAAAAAAAADRRGLERQANQRLADARQQAQFQAVMDVLRTQDEMMIVSGQIDTEELRKVAQKATRVARHFARMMAKADALAAGVELGSSNHEPKEHNNNNNHNVSGSKRTSGSKRRSSKTRSSTEGETTPSSTGTSSSKKSQKEKKSKKKDKDKAAKDKEKVSKDKTSKDKIKDKEKGKDKDRTKDKDSKSKEKDSTKDKDPKSKEKDSTKQKLSLKQKFKETKAGIMARIPRIA